MMLTKRTNPAFLLLAAAAVAILGSLGVGEASVSGESSAFRPRRRVPRHATTKTHAISSEEAYYLHPSVLSAANEDPVKKSLLSIRGGVENTLLNAVSGAAVMALIEKGVKMGFKAKNIDFPSQLGACLILFAFLLVTEVVNPDLANGIFSALSPGAAFLAKWLPVFFVPGLAMLPLAPKIGDTTEVAKVLLVVGLGFIYSLVTTTFTVFGLRKAQGTLVTTKPASASAKGSSKSSPPPKAFSDQTMNIFNVGSLVFFALSLYATKTGNLEAISTPLQTLFLGFATVAAYVWGARLPSGFTKVVHPLVTSCVILLAVVQLLGKATDSTFLDVLRTYKVGSLKPAETGAGDVLLYLLSPAVVSFAISMYSRRSLLRSNFPVVVSAMLVSSVGGLFGTAAFVRAINLGGANGKVVRLSVLSRNVTTALAMALTSMIGGDISIAASVVVMTGIIGATYGKTILTAMGIYDPVSRGLGIGASSQGLGVASMSDEPDAFPFAAISMVLTAMCATTLVSIPAVQDCLINIATGAATVAAETAEVVAESASA